MKSPNGYELERLKSIFPAAPCGVGIFSEQSELPLYFNDAYYYLVGYTPEEYGEQIGKDYQKLIFPNDRNIYKRIAASIASTGGISATEYRILPKNGGIRWVRLTGTSTLVGGGHCVLCFFEDITPEKDSFEQLQLVAESIGNSISVILIQKDKRELVYANDTFFKWVGTDRESYNKDKLEYNMSFIAEEDRVLTKDAVRKSILTGEPEELEYRFLRPGEPLHWMHRRLTAVKRDEPNTYLIISIVTDITDKKELEQNLAFERERYQDVVDNMPSGFVKIRINRNGSATPLFINQTFAEMTQMTVEECMALYREDSCAGVHPDDLARMHKIMEGFQAGVTTSFTIRLRKGNHDWMWVRISTSPREEDGELMLYNSYLDISSEHENDLMLDSLMNELPGGVAIFKVSDTLDCQYFNDGFSALSDRSRQELEDVFHNTGFFENVIYQLDIPQVTDEIKRHSTSGEPINTTFRFLTKSGEVKWLHVNANKLREDEGFPIYYCVFTEPSKQNMLYQSIADESSVGILVSDEKTHEIYYANRMFRELMQITNECYTGKTCYEYVHGRSCACEDCAAGNLPIGKTQEAIKYFPEIGIYVRVRSMLVNWLGRAALVEYASDVTVNHKKQLQQQELLDSVPSGFGIFEIEHGNGRLIYMNDYYYRMVGEAREQRAEQVKANYLAKVHPDDHSAVNTLIDRLDSGSDTGCTDHRIICGNGKYRWFRLTASVVKREDKKLTVYCSYADLDETIKAQQNLEQANKIIQKQYEAEREQRRLLEKDSIISIRFNMTQDRLIEYRVQSQNIVAYTPGIDSETILSDLIQRMPICRERTLVSDFFNNESNIALFQKGITERSIEYRSRQKDRRLHWLLASSRFGHDAFTDDVLTFIYVQDIDFSKKKELAAESLVEEETDYVILLNAAEDKCQILRLKGDFQQYCDWETGKELDFCFFSDPHRLEPVIEEDRESVRRFFDRTAIIAGLKTQPVITVTFRQAIKKNELRRKKIRAFYLDETHEDIIIARRDITDLYEEEQEQKRTLQKALDAATLANHAKTSFLSNMSHEIRTPINAILGMTELAKDEAVSPRVKASLKSIQDSSGYLLRIINDILDMSRIESGKYTLDCQWISPLEVLNPCIEMIRPAAEAKHLTFQTPALDRIGSYEFYVDVLKSQRMLMNLLNNACKFTGDGGRISISFKNKSHDNWHAVDLVTVEDNGCGMSEEFLTHVFTPFAQEHNIYSDTTQGTGLGLSLARQTALAMGGDIIVESKLGVGSKFTIIFPYQYRLCERKTQEDEWPKVDLNVLKGSHILLCEDNHLNTIIAKKLLEKAGCIVDCAENGKIGVEKIAVASPMAYQAVLMDIRMPEMDGLTATKAIRALDRTDAKTMPIVAMSANAFEEDVKTSLAAGMNDHLAKPVEPQKLYEVLARLIRQANISKVL